jgi:DNA-binding response OmpR family regulator
MTVSVEPNVPKILLIVEDQILLAMGLKDELENGGYRVLELAVGHQEALSVARAVKPDLALVNIELAGGDDGVALARDLKRLGIPVLFISGQPNRARLAEAVGLASLSKPYSPAEMVEAVGYLFRHEHGDESRPGPPRLEMLDHIAPPGQLPVGGGEPSTTIGAALSMDLG